jgi:hypothetical protein
MFIIYISVAPKLMNFTNFVEANYSNIANIATLPTFYTELRKEFIIFL